MPLQQREADYYAILNLTCDCSEQAVHDQYRRLVKLLHPDRNGGDAWCQEQLKKVNAAYAVLASRDAKRSYDQRRARRASDPKPFALELEERILGRADPDADKRGNIEWMFEAVTSPASRSQGNRWQIEFVAHLQDSQSVPAPPARHDSTSAIPPVPEPATGKRSSARTVWIVLASLALAAACGCIAAPALRVLLQAGY